MKITLVRHGETVHNVAHMWQGHGDGSLTEVGRQQARLLGKRLAGHQYTRVVASDLDRTMETAREAGLDPEPSALWREIDVGTWSGQSYLEATGGRKLLELTLTEDELLGGGESLAGFGFRVQSALDDLLASMSEDDDVLVVTHGGVIASLAAQKWGLKFPNAIVSMVRNASLTTFSFDFGALRIMSYNDLGHVDPLSQVDLGEGDRLLTFVRHGETDANVRQIWAGHSDWPLNEAGLDQARKLGDWFGPQETLISSDLTRASQTGAALGNPTLHAGLREISMGAWEDLHIDEIEAGWPDLFSEAYEKAQDVKRGGDGESVAELMIRIVRTVNEVMVSQPGQHVVAVSHGSAIRSYVTHVLGGSYDVFRATGLAPNTGLTHVIHGKKGPRLHAYGIATHLE
jgi:broad specificity phosphatase PhoE